MKMNLFHILSQESIKKNLLALLVIILIWGAFILPSSFNPQWGYPDDPTTILMAKSLSEDLHMPKPDGASGGISLLIGSIMLYCFIFSGLT